MSLGVYKGEDRSFPTEFDRLMYVNVKLTMEGFQREKTKPILGFSPKFRHKSFNSFLPLNLEIWKENFEKREILI
jgi:hypothetical protein